MKTSPAASTLTIDQLHATLAAIQLLTAKRTELYRDGMDVNAITGVLYRAAHKLDNEVRTALTGPEINATSDTATADHTDDQLHTCPRCHAQMLYWQQADHDAAGCTSRKGNSAQSVQE